MLACCSISGLAMSNCVNVSYQLGMKEKGDADDMF